MTPREELLRYLAEHPSPKQERLDSQFPLGPNNGVAAENSAEFWAFVAGSMVGIFWHSVIVWFTG